LHLQALFVCKQPFAVGLGLGVCLFVCLPNKQTNKHTDKMAMLATFSLVALGAPLSADSTSGNCSDPKKQVTFNYKFNYGLHVPTAYDHSRSDELHDCLRTSTTSPAQHPPFPMQTASHSTAVAVEATVLL
jgi:hypothetical protein